VLAGIARGARWFGHLLFQTAPYTIIGSYLVVTAIGMAAGAIEIDWHAWVFLIF